MLVIIMLEQRVVGGPPPRFSQARRKLKSAHLHPTQALVTGLAGRSRRAGAVLVLLQQSSPCPCRGGCLRLDSQPRRGEQRHWTSLTR